MILRIACIIITVSLTATAFPQIPKPDGSAIEPVSGAVSGLGHTFTESGDRFISSVGWPAHLVVPLPWSSLPRNPYVATPPLTVQVFPDRRVYPTSKAHPWRTKRAEETIIRDILAPSDVILPGYMTYIVATKSGQVFSGLLTSESPTSITLKQPGKVGTESQPTDGKLQVILRNEIDEMRVSAVSLMPEDLVKLLKPQDAADVIAWIRQPQDRVVLLDDNQALAAALNEGTGTAEFITSDKFSGESSLRITPPQRFSPRINGWEFRIREQPAVGEYRFIRFAWKSPQASGVMLEFAADGQWPPADQTLRRYFAGKNLTGWQAVGIAPRPPAEWTVMSRDLWKDFGDFTLTGIAPQPSPAPLCSIASNCFARLMRRRKRRSHQRHPTNERRRRMKRSPAESDSLVDSISPTFVVSFHSLDSSSRRHGHQQRLVRARRRAFCLTESG